MVTDLLDDALLLYGQFILAGDPLVEFTSQEVASFLRLVQREQLILQEVIHLGTVMVVSLDLILDRLRLL